MQKKHLMKITNFFNTTFLYFTFILAALGLCCLCVGFLCLQWVEGTRPCSAWVSHCSGFFCGGALGCTGFSSCGLRAPEDVGFRWHAGSAAVAHGLCCSAACAVFPDQGSNPCSLLWQADSYPMRHQGSPKITNLLWQRHLITRNRHQCLQCDKVKCTVNIIINGTH